MPMADVPDTLIQYPCQFAIKVMAIAHDDLLTEIIEVAITHDPHFTEEKVSTRPSAKGNYLGVTLDIHATSREQLDNLYRALSGHRLVKMVL
jgi:putative lipoic acid-binding regulatory protein